LGIIDRMSTILRSKMNALFDRAEDPRQALDYSYERQVQMLQQVKRGVVDVITAKRRLELQAVRLHDQADQMEAQARQALQTGREDLARAALQRRQETLLQLQELDAQVADLEKEQAKLALSEQRLTTKVESFRTKKETIKAQYSAAEAEVKIGESATGLSEEMADVSLAVQRAQEKTDRLRARAAAIDEMVQEGLLKDATATGDPLARQIDRLSAAQNVENELASLKAEVGHEQGQLPPAGKSLPPGEEEPR
jgi:phage shock protein A